jgi:hypothetical protein
LINIENIAKYDAVGNRLITVSGISTPILASFLEMSDRIKIDHPVLTLIINAISNSTFWLYALFVLIFCIGKYLTRKGDYIVWKALQIQANKLQEIAFPDSDDIKDNHRVTVFKHKRWSWSWFRFSNKYWKQANKGCWPWSGWLAPIIRSSHTGKGTKAIFWAPSEGTKAEGVAGKCWASKSTVAVNNLPNLSKSSNDRNRDRYCKNSNINRSIIDRYCLEEKSLARHLVAYPIVANFDRVWGVVVIDSMEANGVDEENAAKAFETMAPSIGVLIEGI